MKLLTLGTEHFEVQQPDVLVLELNDFEKALVFRFALEFQRLAPESEGLKSGAIIFNTAYLI